MRLPLSAIVACFALVLTGAAGAADDTLLAPPGTCGAADSQLNLDAATAVTVMTCLTNYARTQSGLRPLQVVASLNAAGNAKLSADVSCGEFSHTPCGKLFQSVFAAYLSGASSYQVGENIAWGTGSYGTPRQTMSAWLHSTGHRQNILTGSFTDLGIGYAPSVTFEGYSGAALWSQEFGTRSPAASRSTTTATARTAVKKRRAHTRVAHLRRG